MLAKTKAECIEKLKKLQREYGQVAPFKIKPDMGMDITTVCKYYDEVRAELAALETQ